MKKLKKGVVYLNNEQVGILYKDESHYVFRYFDEYFMNVTKKAISVTLPKTQIEYQSNILFPFFFNMLSEGVNRKLQCNQLKIGENDYFSLLLATSNNETIGAITIHQTE